MWVRDGWSRYAAVSYRRQFADGVVMRPGALRRSRRARVLEAPGPVVVRSAVTDFKKMAP